MTLKKKLFVFQFDHSVDLITNSSSELFVFKQDTKENVKELVSQVYPNYLHEYEEVRSVEELTEDELHTLLCFMYDNYWYNRVPPRDLPKFKGFTFKETWRRQKAQGFQEQGSTWSLKVDNLLKPEKRKCLLDILDSKRNICFLFSLGENPNFEKQELLETISTRYHLG